MKEFGSFLWGIGSFLLLSLLSVVGWFFRRIYVEHRDMLAHYNKTKGKNLDTMIINIATLSTKVDGIKSEDKRYREDNRKEMESFFKRQEDRANGNYGKIMESLEFMKDKQKTSDETVTNIIKGSLKRQEVLESRLNSHLDKD